MTSESTSTRSFVFRNFGEESHVEPQTTSAILDAG